MREELLSYYERELTFLRQMGKDFASTYPKVASRLQLEPDRCEDPHVERLLEAFAFLCARVHLKIDDDFPEIMLDHLNRHVYIRDMNGVTTSPVPSGFPPGLPAELAAAVLWFMAKIVRLVGWRLLGQPREAMGMEVQRYLNGCARRFRPHGDGFAPTHLTIVALHAHHHL